MKKRNSSVKIVTFMSLDNLLKNIRVRISVKISLKKWIIKN